MKQAVYNKKGTKQIIDTGWKEFDRQTNAIFVGNCIFNTQFSRAIRPYSATECNGKVNPEGYLMDFDLNPFRSMNVPKNIMNGITDVNRKEDYILYAFSIRNKNHHSNVWSFVLTDINGKLIDFKLVGKYSEKRLRALYALLPYISEQGCFC